MEDLAPACPAYSHFRECLSKDYTDGTASLKFKIKQVPTDFIPCFDYDRIKEMVKGHCCILLSVHISTPTIMVKLLPDDCTCNLGIDDTGLIVVII